MRPKAISNNRILSSQQWIDLFLQSDPSARPPLVDIRPLHDFTEQHVHSSTHFGGISGEDGLVERLNELPPPSKRGHMAIVGETIEQANSAIQYLTQKNYSQMLAVTAENIFSHLPKQSGYMSRPLWEPAPILLHFLPQIIEHVPCRTALDIGSGSGRDSTWLYHHGFKVTAVDRDEKLMNKAVKLAHRTDYANWFHTNPLPQHFTAVTRTFGVDSTDDINFLKLNASCLVLVVRFLRRGVLEHLWHAVAPGGYIVYEHFLVGCEKFPNGPRKISQMLQPGELKEIFSSGRGFHCICDEQSTLSDGRPIVRFVARRCVQVGEKVKE